jgi:hypothetical protein
VIEGLTELSGINSICLENKNHDKYVETKVLFERTAEEVARYQHRKIIKVQDNEFFLDEIGADESGNQNNANQNLFEMSHNDLLKLFHYSSPAC